MPRRARCSACHAEILWAITSKDNRMPLDAEPDEHGNVVLTDRGVAEVHSQRPLGYDGPLYMPHHATCPKADEFRRKR